MSEVTLWLRVTRGGRNPYEGAPVDLLMTRDVPMPHLPTPGVDEVEIYPGEGGGVGEGPRLGVYWRYWDFEGRAHLELTEIHVDPDPGADGRWWSDYNSATKARGLRATRWLSEDDGDPLARLLAAGWNSVGLGVA